MYWIRETAVAWFALAVVAWLAVALWRALAASRRRDRSTSIDADRIRSEIREKIAQRRDGPVPPANPAPAPSLEKKRAGPWPIDPFGGPWRRTWQWLRQPKRSKRLRGE